MSLKIIQNHNTKATCAPHLTPTKNLDESKAYVQMENLNPFPLSLTIWTGASDQVDRDALARFIEIVGKDR